MHEIRKMTDLDMLTDVSWIHGKIKQKMGKYYIRKYGQCYNKGRRHLPGGRWIAV